MVVPGESARALSGSGHMSTMYELINAIPRIAFSLSQNTQCGEIISCSYL